MPRFLSDWWSRRRRERPDRLDRRHSFSQVGPGDLDILMPPPYDVSDSKQIAARARIEALVGKLQPGGLDAGSREVLNNLINAVADQEAARLQAERDERQAVGEILIGLAQKQVSRYRPRYDADFAVMHHAHEALVVTYKALTGRELKELRSPFPRHTDNDPVGSSFGPVDITDSWSRSAAATAAATDVPASPITEEGPSVAGEPEQRAWPKRPEQPDQPKQPKCPVIGPAWDSGSGSMPPTYVNGQYGQQAAGASGDPYGGGDPDNER